MKKKFLLIIVLTAFTRGPNMLYSAASSNSSLSDDYHGERTSDTKRSRPQDDSPEAFPHPGVKRSRSLTSSSSSNTYNPSQVLDRKGYQLPIGGKSFSSLLSTLTRANIRNLLAHEENLSAFASLEAFEEAKHAFGLAHLITEDVLSDAAREYHLNAISNNLNELSLPEWLSPHFSGVSVQDLIERGKIKRMPNHYYRLESAYINDLTGSQKLFDAETLNLEDNLITHVGPGDFFGLENLRNLYLSRNQIKTIDPEAFRGLDNLKVLGLDYNTLITIPTNIFVALPKLKTLGLRGNNIPEKEQARIKEAAGPNINIIWQ